MANGDTTTLSVGEYKGSDWAYGSYGGMLDIKYLGGTIQCLRHDVSCVLDGELNKRIMRVYGSSSSSLNVRAIRFYRGKVNAGGGGLEVYGGGKVILELCIFDSCQSTHSIGGGGIYVYGFNSIVSIYSTLFTENVAPSGKGNDISQATSGTVTIHETCPSPYSANTPTQGKYKNSVHHSALI